MPLSIQEINRGDDYEIVFTSDKSNRERIEKIFKKENIPVSEIGLINKGSEVDIITPEGDFQKASSRVPAFLKSFMINVL